MPTKTDRLRSGAHYLAREFSATPDEFRRDNHPGGDMLLTGLLNTGYAIQKGGRVALTPAGTRMMEGRP